MAEDTAGLMKAIAELSDYVARKDVTPQQLSQFLTLKTLKPLGCEQVFISQLDPDGMVRTNHAFGVTEDQMESWKELPLSEKLPVTDAIRNDQLIWLADSEDWKREYPEILKYKTNILSKTTIMIAIDVSGAPAGVLGMISKFKINPNPELIAFVTAVSGLVALYVSQFKNIETRSNSRNSLGANGEFLSSRQIRILDLMGQSYTNPQIARELGFSESTVRQETMRIYQILQVGGRKEAIQQAHIRNLISA